MDNTEEKKQLSRQMRRMNKAVRQALRKQERAAKAMLRETEEAQEVVDEAYSWCCLGQ